MIDWSDTWWEIHFNHTSKRNHNIETSIGKSLIEKKKLYPLFSKVCVYTMTRGPTMVRVAPGGGHSGGGIKCCCCRCCVCFNFGYLVSQHGLIKLAEAMLGGLCQSLLVKYGMSEASSMGSAFHGFLTTASACLLTTVLLITCYVLSSKTQQLIRQSIFECLFNAVSSFLYLSASSYMAVAVNIYLYPRYALVNMYAAYPAMTAVYYIGVVVGIIHGVDAYLAYKFYRCPHMC